MQCLHWVKCAVVKQKYKHYCLGSKGKQEADFTQLCCHSSVVEPDAVRVKTLVRFQVAAYFCFFAVACTSVPRLGVFIERAFKSEMGSTEVASTEFWRKEPPHPLFVEAQNTLNKHRQFLRENFMNPLDVVVLSWDREARKWYINVSTTRETPPLSQLDGVEVRIERFDRIDHEG